MHKHILTESRFFFDLLSSDSLSDKDFLLAPSVFSFPAFWEFRKASISSGQSKFSSGSHVLSALKHTHIYVKLGKEEKHSTSHMAHLKQATFFSLHKSSFFNLRMPLILFHNLHVWNTWRWKEVSSASVKNIFELFLNSRYRTSSSVKSCDLGGSSDIQPSTYQNLPVHLNWLPAWFP